MSISRLVISLAAFLLPLSIALPGAEAQTAAQDPCTKAYVSKSWSDVISVCGQETTIAGHSVYTSTSQSKDERVAEYNTLVSGTLYLVQAYAATGNTRMAQINLSKAQLWMQLAEQQGIGSDSREYQAWESELKAAQAAEAAATPTPRR